MTSPTVITPSRIAWLARLERGPAHRPRGTTGISCMRAGWTSWVWIKADGGTATSDDVAETFGRENGSWGCAREAGWELTNNETLTAAGRKILDANRDLLPTPPAKPAKD